MSPVNATQSNIAATVALATLVAERGYKVSIMIKRAYPRPLRMDYYTYIGIGSACLARAFVWPPPHNNISFFPNVSPAPLPSQLGLSGVSLVPLSSPLPYPPRPPVSRVAVYVFSLLVLPSPGSPGPWPRMPAKAPKGPVSSRPLLSVCRP